MIASVMLPVCYMVTAATITQRFVQVRNNAVTNLLI